MPDAVTWTAVVTEITSDCGNCTAVRCMKVGGAGPVTVDTGGCCTKARRISAGTAMATILSQYWNACTKVIPFMPPLAIPRVTMPPSTTTPIQTGPPTATCRVTPAPLSCGSR